MNQKKAKLIRRMCKAGNTNLRWRRRKQIGKQIVNDTIAANQRDIHQGQSVISVYKLSIKDEQVRSNQSVMPYLG